MVLLDCFRELNAVNIIVIIAVVVIVILLAYNHIKISHVNYNTPKCDCVPIKSPNANDKNTEKNIVNESINSENNKPVLGLYYTAWCGFSKSFFPEWEKIKQELKEEVVCEQYNCDESNEICNRNNIRGYPSLILHKINGTKIPYNGQRDVISVCKFVREKLSQHNTQQDNYDMINVNKQGENIVPSCS